MPRANGFERNGLLTSVVVKRCQQDNRQIERTMLNADPHGFLYRTVAAIAGFVIISFGVAPLLHGGDLFGTNWFGELVFAPLAIVLGLIVVAFALFKPEWLGARRAQSPTNIRKSRWGINLKSLNCPRCNRLMPTIRKPKSMWEALWGGWTCENCGCSMDKWGREIKAS